MHFSIDRTVHTTAFDKPVVDHWLERKIAQTATGSTEKDRSDDRPLQRRARYRLSYIPLRLADGERRFNVRYVRAINRSSLSSKSWVSFVSVVHLQQTPSSFCVEGRKEMFYLTTHSTHFIYGYMASDIWKRTIQIARESKPAAATWVTLSD